MTTPLSASGLYSWLPLKTYVLAINSKDGISILLLKLGNLLLLGEYA